jgi:hypothetical protein
MKIIEVSFKRLSRPRSAELLRRTGWEKVWQSEMLAGERFLSRASRRKFLVFHTGILSDK